MQAPMCSVCNKKPCYPDGNGGYYTKCGKTCTAPTVIVLIPTTKPTVPTCSVCKVAPCAPDPNGGHYTKCKRSCVTTNSNTTTSPNPKVALCTVCGIKPCAFDVTNKVYYQFCGKTCASKKPTITTSPSKVPLCKSCGSKPCASNSNGGYFDKCRKGCGGKFSISSSNSGHSELSSSDRKYQEISSQFTNKWKKPGTPVVKHIIKLKIDSKFTSNYATYQKIVDTDMKNRNIQPKNTYCGPGNENRRFHGTRQECDFGLQGNLSECSNSNCAVCSIIKTGFRISVTPKFERFGYGVYSTSTSGKSNDYVGGSGLGGLRSMFVCKVIVGKGHHLTMDCTNMDLTQLKQHKCHSVLGETKDSKFGGGKGTLNHDELIVYDTDAIIPAYLIIYKV
jgi:hypothetical protein